MEQEESRVCKICEVEYFFLPSEMEKVRHTRKYEFCQTCRKQADRAYDDYVDPLRAYH